MTMTRWSVPYGAMEKTARDGGADTPGIDGQQGTSTLALSRLVRPSGSAIAVVRR